MRTYEGKVNECHLFLRWEAHNVKPSSWWKNECMGMDMMGMDMECCHSWDAEGSVAIGGPLTGRLGNILFVSFSPDSQFLVSTTSYGIIVWDVGSRKKEIRAVRWTLFLFHWILFQQQDICSWWSAGDLWETSNALRHVVILRHFGGSGTQTVGICRHIPTG